jgi:tetratricopeptide (TPR) repeat protein
MPNNEKVTQWLHQSIKVQVSKASEGRTAADYFNEALRYWVDGKCTDPSKAIKCLTEAIRLDPDYALAYYNRGLAYEELGRILALEDYKKAINLMKK